VRFLRAGQSYLLKEPGIEKRHLWFILTDPDSRTNEVLAVKVVPAKEYTDKTLELFPGDHPFIKHKSCVDFSSARRFSQKQILKSVTKNLCHPKDPMSSTLLERARRGMLNSPHAVRFFQDYCRERI